MVGLALLDATLHSKRSESVNLLQHDGRRMTSLRTFLALQDDRARPLSLQMLLAAMAVFLWLSSVTNSNAGAPKFVEVTASGAIPFRHSAPLSRERHMHLFMGAGLGWLDFDRDGALDLLCCQGAPADYEPSPGESPGLSLSRGTGLEFQERSAAAGLRGRAYAFGLTIADYDNDGFADVFVTGLMTAALYHNNGDGTFTNHTSAAGIVPFGFGSGCCWTDLDNDGDLDLFYARYLALDLEKYPLCTSLVGKERIPYACSPIGMKGEADSVYLNRGDGSFEDASKRLGLADAPQRKGLGVVAIDLDDDGQCEIYVANDGNPNELWVRRENGRFEEIGQLAGVAVNRAGFDEAGMGIAVGDVDGDLRPELYVTNFFNETNTLYRNEGQLLFLDATEGFNLAIPSLQRLGFGNTLADFDNDGWPDLLIANGHVMDNVTQLRPKNPEPYAQNAQLMQNHSGRRFEDVSRQAGAFFNQPFVSRGTAAADVDADGRVDVAVLRLNEQAALLKNSTTDSGNWVAIDLQGMHGNRDAVGATVILRAGKNAWRRDRMASAGYLSCDSPSLHFGVANHQKVDSVFVRWPGGAEEEFDPPVINQRIRLVEGTGRTLKAARPSK